jgi:demethylmenaquinone methyltransferase/2-methoxy-6-polyprenyl-1,4-benzoquinol methylase
MRDDFEARMEHQLDYYRERAPEYDDWALRRGNFDLGEEGNAHWFEEVARLEDALREFDPGAGKVLELACGTGQWTERLAALSENITAVDASTEVLDENRKRNLRGVRYLQADLFTWEPDKKYDVVFFSFWLSHVPSERFAQFWDLVQRALAPGGRVFFIDNLPGEAHPERRWVDDETVVRRLSNGSEFQVWKVLYEPADLVTELSRLGWNAVCESVGEFFLWGEATRATAGG